MRSRIHRRSQESGYVLMVIMFLMAMLMMGLLATAPAVKTQLQRDREEEMIHRGAQYSRAIKKYFKKFGRYPASIDQLKNTNNIRFLRKEYKDPMTPDGKWRLLHVGENLPGLQLGQASKVGTPVSALGSLGGAAVGQAVAGAASAFGAAAGFGTSGSSFGTSGATLGGTSALGATVAGQPTGGVVLGAQGTTGSSTSATGISGLSGLPIIGVASASEKDGLHEFNEKKKYKEWYFVYDPTTDRGGLITGPYTGKTFGTAGGIGTPIGQPGQQPGTAGQPSGFGQPSAFGQPSSFGQPSAFGQPSSFGGMGQPTPPQPQQPTTPR